VKQRLKILVTGGSGFIGSHVVDVLAERGHTPIVFDRVPSTHHNGDIETVLGDCTDVEVLAAAMKDCQAVVHLAAMADVNDVQADPEGAERANSCATLSVLEAARRCGVKRVVYGSTIWVYSDCPETAVDEDTLVHPPSHLYTATKLAGELYCRSYAELYDVDYTILRFGIPYGPRARDATVLAAFTKKALAGDPLTVAGSGDQSRRFIYVEDLADGVERALAPEAAKRIYNLAGNETTTIIEIARAVQELVGDVEIVHTEARAGDFGGKEVSSDRALAELGWAPATPFCEGARRYVHWRRERELQPPLTGRALLRARARGALNRVRVARSRLPLRRLRPALSMLAVVGGLAWSFMSDDGLATLGSFFHGLRPATAVETNRPEVGLIVEAPTSVAPSVAAELAHQGGSASIALAGSVSTGTVDQVHSYGSDAVPRLKGGGMVRWIGTRTQLHGEAKRLGLSGHYYYASPERGFTLAQELIGKVQGASPLAAAVHFGGDDQKLGNVHRGDLVEATVDAGSWRAELDSLCAQLRARGLHAVSAAALVQSARNS
jgi:UDP-glucose 4-epimerase